MLYTNTQSAPSSAEKRKHAQDPRNTRWPMQPLFSSSLLFAMLLASFLWSPQVGATGPQLTQISSDPYTSGPPSQHQTEAEPHVLAFGGVLVATMQAGRNTSVGSTNIGWSTSLDGGHTWTSGFLQGTTTVVGGSYTAIADSVVAYDVYHAEWLIISLASTNLGPVPGGWAILVNRSLDGIHWDSALTVSASLANEIYDKPWLVCDTSFISPFLGHCYVTWSDVLFSSTGSFSITVDMTTSSDGGLTWGPPLQPAGGFVGAAGVPQVQPTGRVIVPLVGLNPQTLQTSTIASFVSTTGGASWSAVVTVTPIQFHAPSGGMVADALPASAEDAFGKIFLVWSDCRFETGCSANDLVMTTTLDGLHWSPVQRLATDAVGSGVDHFIPGVGIDPSTAGNHAHLAVVYYFYPAANCAPATCQLNVGLVESSDGGASWSSVTRLAGPMQLNWLASSDNGGLFVGDYIALAFSVHRPVPVFAVAQPLVSGQFRQAIFTVSCG